MKRKPSIGMLGASFVALAAVAAITPAAAQVAIDNDDIGGVVTGPKGPEAGVWVIAETRDLPVRFIRIVVTDDQGRYVVPDLPKANYDVWVRGYGLVDSPKVKSTPGKQLNLTAVPAPNETAAALQLRPSLRPLCILRYLVRFGCNMISPSPRDHGADRADGRRDRRVHHARRAACRPAFPGPPG